MIFSVWRQDKEAFDYFEAPLHPIKLNTPKPSHLMSRTLGSTVEQASWPLPARALYVGSGAAAVGRIATKKTGSALGDVGGDDLSIVKAGLLAVSAYLIWRYVTPSPRRRHA